MILNDPWFLLFLLAVPVVLLTYFRTYGSIGISTTAPFHRINPSLMLMARYILPVLRGACIVLLAIALARPRKGMEEIRATTEGIDIVLAIDTSGSMRAVDNIEKKKIDRLQAAKEAVKEFIEARKEQYDRIAMVAFAMYPATQCPLTLDYTVLQEFVEKLDFAPPKEGATALGLAIGESINLLKNSKAKSKIVILLTDGRNTFGMKPMDVAPAAVPFGVKIYTIGVGSKMPYIMRPDPFGREVWQRIDRPDFLLDEPTLKEIAKTTGGRYFRATDPDSLKQIYADIDKMEKTRVEVRHYVDYQDLFHWFLFPAMGLLLVEVALAGTRFRRVP
ncbi:MAG: VWA domain-containing protein [Planctomycetes bacterium]|nr:VWA domain-containing protein [Planctomycetota bacterium]